VFTKILNELLKDTNLNNTYLDIRGKDGEALEKIKIMSQGGWENKIFYVATRRKEGPPLSVLNLRFTQPDLEDLSLSSKHLSSLFVEGFSKLLPGDAQALTWHSALKTFLEGLFDVQQKYAREADLGKAITDAKDLESFRGDFTPTPEALSMVVAYKDKLKEANLAPNLVQTLETWIGLYP